MSILEQARSNIRALKPYSSARSENTNQNISIWLDANENPWPPYSHPEASSRRYEFQQPPTLVKAMSAAYNIAPQQLLIARGADEAIDLLIRVFCEPGVDKILQCSPTFGMYQVSAAIQNCQTIDIPLSADFQLNIPAVLEAITDCKIAFFCSPGNPTANLLNKDDLHQICVQAPNTVIAIDEAYIDFTQTSHLNLLAEFDNVVLLRTLSKAYSLAGERIGGMIARPEVIELCGRVLPPYPLSATACQMAVDALSDQGLIENQRRIRTIIEERDKLAEGLKGLSCVETVYPSDANFLLLKMRDSQQALKALEDNSIKVRDRSSVLPEHIRVTIGTSVQNKQLYNIINSLQ